MIWFYLGLGHRGIRLGIAKNMLGIAKNIAKNTDLKIMDVPACTRSVRKPFKYCIKSKTISNFKNSLDDIKWVLL